MFTPGYHRRSTLSRLRSVLCLATLMGLCCLTQPVSAQIGPDLIVGDVLEEWQFGRVGPIGSGTIALGFGTDVCNQGDETLHWYQLPSVDHPVIIINLYRLQTYGGADRFQQLGQSWIKHGSGASQSDSCAFGCTPHPNGQELGVGCSDMYTAWQYWPCDDLSNQPLAPRSVIHPYTGAMPSGPDMGPDGECEINYPSANHTGHTHDVLSHRLQVDDVDLMTDLNPGARYFSEGQYVARHEYVAGNGNQNNNVSHREISVAGPDQEGLYVITVVGNTIWEQPAVGSWPDAMGTVIEPAPMGDGRSFLAFKATDLGSGTWHYEYAIYNMNMDSAIGSFSVPVPSGVMVSGIGFYAPRNHPPVTNADNYSNDPWSISTSGGAVTWSTDPFDVDPLANAVRWGTLYNFWFDADSQPQSRYATIGLFKIARDLSAATLAPRPTGPQDCNNNQIDDTCDLDCDAPGCAVQGCGTATDCDGTGVPDECEIDCNGNLVDDRCDIAEATSLDCTGNGVPDECEPDCNGDEVADSCEIAAGTDTDCNANGVPDACESGTTGVRGINPCACIRASAPQPGAGAVENRFLSVAAGDAGQTQAIRVTIVSLQPPYDTWNDERFYVGMPHRVCENAGHGPGVPIEDCGPAPGLPKQRNWNWFAPLVCSLDNAYYTDWHGACVDSSCFGGLKGGDPCETDDDCVEAVHLYHEGIVPSKLQAGGGAIEVPSQYEVQLIGSDCSPEDEGNFSEPLALTQPGWGDIVENCVGCPCGPPDDTVSVITDVVSLLDKFANLSCAPKKSRSELQPQNVDFKLDIFDVVQCLTAFQGGSYPFTPSSPDPCP